MAQFNSYPTKATPIAADTVLIYDSAGAILKQVPIKNLFENYAGTSLGGSAQTVKSAIDALNSKIKFGYGSYEITDSIHGFIDSGVSAASYVILCAYTLTSSNNIIEISNLSGDQHNFRFQIRIGTTQEIRKSGTFTIHYWYMSR